MSSLTPVRGALGFLTRLPVGGTDSAWAGFRESPWAFPVAAYPIGAVIALPLVSRLPTETATVAALAAVYGLTGIVHLDGVADLGDAAVVHGDSDDRRAVLKDTTVGVGALAAVGLTLVGLTLGLAGIGEAGARTTVAVVVASEVGAKLGMSLVASVGVATHEGLGSAFTTRCGPDAVLPAALCAVPAGLLGVPEPTALGALVGATVGGLVVFRWADRRLGGVSGDVFGAVNELGRVAGLHAGVIVWTVS